MGARGAAYFIPGDGAAVLVGGDARAAACGELWAGGALYVRDGAAFGIARSIADVRANCVVSGLFRQHSGMGADPFRRSATRWIDHVDSGGAGLRGGGFGADGGMAEGVGAAGGCWGI